MAEVAYKIGDRVVVNDRSTSQSGKKGTIRYVSGNQYWVRFDGEGDMGQLGFFPWWLDLLP